MLALRPSAAILKSHQQQFQAREEFTLRISMSFTISRALALAVLGGALFTFANGLATAMQASPRKTAELVLNGKKISLDYGAPAVRGRKVMGELVPYDKVWRLGANKATHLTTEADLVIGGLNVPAGTYTLFAFPSANGWKLIVNKKTGQWGIPYPPEDEKMELGRVNMKVEQTPALVEQMLLALDKAGSGGVLKMEWENTRVSINLAVKK